MPSGYRLCAQLLMEMSNRKGNMYYVLKIFATLYENNGLISDTEISVGGFYIVVHRYFIATITTVTKFLILLLKSFTVLQGNIGTYADTSTHTKSTVGNNNQLEYPCKGWLHHVNYLIQMSFS